MKYKIIVDKQSRKNPSPEKKEYEIDIEELRSKGNVHDSLVITKDEDYVVRRLELTKYYVLKELENPVKEPLNDINIKLFEGDNYVYLVDMEGNRIYAEYLIKNDFNDVYITKSEAHSEINQSADKIEISVNKKLEEYSTTEEMNSVINQTAEGINQIVSKKVGEDEIISKINQSAEKIEIKADKINIDGKAASFKTEVTSKYEFSQEDIIRMSMAYVGNYTLTPTEKELYDLNGDGKISVGDIAKMQLILTGEMKKDVDLKGSFQINPYDALRPIILKDKNNNTITTIGLLFMETQDFRAKMVSIKDAGTIHKTNNYIDMDAKHGFSVSIDTNNDIALFTKDKINFYRQLDMGGQDIINAGNTISDKRLKENIKDSKIYALDRIKKITHRMFKWKESKKQEKIGYIAQELEEIDPNYVSHNITKDENGKVISDMYEVKILPILSTATKAIQEQQEQIENMAKRIEELERR